MIHVNYKKIHRIQKSTKKVEEKNHAKNNTLKIL